MNKPQRLSVEQLIRELERLPGHLPVQIEGCDCVGFVAGVTDYSAADYVPGVGPGERFPTVLVYRTDGDQIREMERSEPFGGSE